jgi:hypothetical protein
MMDPYGSVPEFLDQTILAYFPYFGKIEYYNKYFACTIQNRILDVQSAGHSVTHSCCSLLSTSTVACELYTFVYSLFDLIVKWIIDASGVHLCKLKV